MRVSICILLAALAVVSWRLIIERQTHEEQQKQVRELTSRLSERDAHQRLEFQEKCALQAEKIFRAMGYKLDADSLQSHYHEKRGHCFMVMAPGPKSNPDGTFFTFKYLLDAYEQKSLAEYAWMSKKSTPYSQVPPFICKLIPSVGEETTCKSNEEFEKFVAVFME